MNASNFVPSRCAEAKLRALINEAIRDCEDESDEHSGLFGTIKEEVICPFPAMLDGEEVECLGFQCPPAGYALHAICKTKKGKTLIVDADRLEPVGSRPEGYDWIEAYFAWRSMQD